MTDDMKKVISCMNAVYDIKYEDFDGDHKIMPKSGLYVRYLNMKAGEMVIGNVHKEWNVNIIAKGTVVIMADIQGAQVRLTAPHVFETGPGSQKIIKALTDSTIMNILTAKAGEDKDMVFKRLAESSEELSKEEVESWLQ